jgi:hypothetical protein
MSTSKPSESNSGPRELIKPHEGDARYQRRTASGQFGPADSVKRSQRADKARQSSVQPPDGQGDKGDHAKKK